MTSRPGQIDGKGGCRTAYISSAPSHLHLMFSVTANLINERIARTTLAFTSSAAYDGSRLLLQRPSCNASRVTLGRGLCGLRRLGVA